MNDFPASVIEISPTWTPSGIVGPAAALEFEGCNCEGCGIAVAGHLSTDAESGSDYAVWTDVWMDAEWRLWCEDCALEVPEEPEAHDLHNCMCDTCDEDRAELGYVRARRF